MALEALKQALGMEQNEAEPIKVPPDVEEKLKRGRERLRQVAPRRQVAVEFANGFHYSEVADDGLRVNKSSVVAASKGGEKPDHRVRRSHDLIGPIVKAKISGSTKAIPRYEAIPSSPDAEDFTAARLSEKVARGGYDLWRFRKARKKLAWHALVEEEGFIVPYWDASVGPYITVDKTEPVEVAVVDPETGEPTGVMQTIDQPTGETETLGMGEVALLVLGGREVIWEPGVEFEESRWWSIENARPTEAVEEEAGYIGGKLTADAEMSDKGSPKRESGTKLVMVTEYLERPCPKYPEGRKLVFANGKQIFPEETYPLRNEKDEVVDEPCIHRLTYSIDGNSDRGKGLVGSLIESMRTYDHAANKEAEYLQLVLTPQIMAQEGSILSPITDEPGSVIEYEAPLPGMKEPEWRNMPTMPREYGEARDRAQAEMGVISHDNAPPPRVESGKAIQSLQSKDALAWEDFIEEFAEVDARVMRDCLCLVQRHYTEDRLVKFRGRTGWENIADFKGADIRGQTDIYVPPASLEAKTRQQIEQRIMNIAQMFPGYYPPEVLISAMEGGNAEKLIEGHEDDVAWVNKVIAQIRSGQFWSLPKRPVVPGEEPVVFDPNTGEPVWEVPPQFDEMGMLIPGTGKPLMETELPGWMPLPFANVPVQKMTFETWLKSDDWANLDEANKRASLMVYDALLKTEARKAQEQAQMQTQMAESQGAANAAKPGQKPMPSLPAAPESGEEGT